MDRTGALSSYMLLSGFPVIAGVEPTDQTMPMLAHTHMQIIRLADLLGHEEPRPRIETDFVHEVGIDDAHRGSYTSRRGKMAGIPSVQKRFSAESLSQAIRMASTPNSSHRQ
ncbi:hypothetical protein [Alistipes senegalensis]|uniref:hypothetical protein n=1 Tax=Alistipes senegalensis TaxID=1288121 RepID=UPI00189BA180|nr:hypothetical protein [Alistipes senegalensis]MBD9301641.1 hypothetical protein [Alistipes senegalensis]